MFGAIHKTFFHYVAKASFFATLAMSCALNATTSGDILVSDNAPVLKTNSRDQGTVEKVTIYSQVSEGSTQRIARKGILVHFKNAKATILVAHGYMTNKFDVGFLRNLFPYGQFNFLTFDFRAHGEDVKGQSCTLGRDEALDVIAAAKFLKAHPALKDKPLFAYAFSMGAVATIEAQAKDSSLFSAMILDCPFDSSENLIKRSINNMKFSLFGYEFSIPGKSLLQKHAFHPYVQSLVKLFLKSVANMDPRKIETNVFPVYPAASIAKVTVPCFFIHCKQDEKVPVSAIKEVYKGAAGPKMLWLTNGRNHYDSLFYNPDKYVHHVRQFFDQVLAGQWKNKQEQKVIEDSEDAIGI